MSTTSGPTDVPRDRPDWLTQTDEEILEVLRDEGNMTPQALADTYEVAARNYARDRLSVMREHGWVERIGRGLYRLDEPGRAFLDEK